MRNLLLYKPGRWLSIPKNLQPSQPVLVEGFETFADWTFTLATGSDDTTRFSQGTHGLKLTSDGTSNTPTAHKTVTNLDISQAANVALDIYVHAVGDVARQVRIWFWTSAARTKGFLLVMPATYRERWNRVVLPQTSWSAAGGMTVNDLVNLIEVRFMGSASGQNFTIDNWQMGLAPIPRTGGVSWTFHDNHVSHYTVALPLFQRRGFKATALTCSAGVYAPGQAGRLTLAQIQGLLGAGWSFMNHGTDHSSFTSLTQAQIETQLADCRTAMLTWGVPDRMTHWCCTAGGGMNDDIYNAFIAQGITSGQGGAGEANIRFPHPSPLAIGYTPTTGISLATLQSQALAARDGGYLIDYVCHDIGAGGDTTEAIIAAALDFYKQNKITVFTRENIVDWQSDAITVRVPW